MALDLKYRHPHFVGPQFTTFLADSGMPQIFSFGTNWTSPWRAYVVKTRVHSTSQLVAYFVYPGDGGVLHFLGTSDGSGNPLAVAGPDTASRSFLNYTNNVFTLVRPNGDRETYDVQVDLKDDSAATRSFWFIGKREVKAGHPLSFTYSTNNNVVKLTAVKDVDNNQFTFTYGTDGFYSNVVTQVSAPFGLSASLAYDGQGFLTNITDAVGISSGLAYASTENRLSTMVTPYGTNDFYYATNSGRSVRIVENGVRTHLYWYNSSSSPYSETYPYPTIPLVDIDGLSSRFVSASSYAYNTYYWSPKAYPVLSADMRAGVESDVAWGWTSNDLSLARSRRWLVRKWLGDNGNGDPKASGALGMQRDPSPDGTGLANCLYSWFDYEGQTAWTPRPASDVEGSSFAPRFVVKADHDGNVYSVKVNLRDSNLKITQKIESYSSPTTGEWLYRTNNFVWSADGADRLSETLLIGNTAKVIWSNVYTPDHLVVTNFNALNEATYFTYDASHRRTSERKPTGLVITNTFGGDGYLAARTFKNASSTFYAESFTFANGMPASTTDGRGMTTSFLYDKLGRLRKTSFPDATFITNVYVNLDLVRRQDRMGFTNGWAYNRFRQVIYATNANFGITTNTYCDCGQLESTSDPAGNTTSWTADTLGRVLVTTLPGGTRATNGWDLLNRLSWKTDSTGAGTTNVYNVQGLVAKVLGPNGLESERVFDIEDHVITSTDRNGVTAWQTFDELGRVKARTYTNSPSQTMTYSPKGLIGITNQLGTTISKITFDELGRKVGETNALNEVTLYSYNGIGDLLSLTDGKSQTTSWQYDVYGRVTNKVDAATQTILKYTYDANNRLATRWSGKGTTSYSYDSVGNLTKVDYPSSVDTTFSYDGANRVVRMVDASGTNIFTYTSFGALASEDGPWAGDTLSLDYATNRLRKSLSLSGPTGSPWTQTYGYDDAKRLTSVASGAGSFNYGYKWLGALETPASLVASIALPNGLSITNDYDALGRQILTHLKDVSGSSFINRHDYMLDAANRRTNQTRWNGDYVGYSYDGMGQLKTAYAKEVGGTDRQHERYGYSYDAAGNLSYRTNNAMTQTFNVNSLNELTTVTRDTNQAFIVAGATTVAATSVTINGTAATRYADNTFSLSSSASGASKTFTATATDALGRQATDATTVTLPASVSYSYDLNGNLLNDGKRYFVYDDENQLSEVYETNKWRSMFVYDGMLRRRVSKEFTWASSTWTLTNEIHYIYDGKLVIQERDANNLPLVTFTRGLDLSGTLSGAGGIGGLLARTDVVGQESTFYHSDANGNVTLLVDMAKQPAARYVYDAYGNLVGAAGRLADVNRYRFSSKEAHANSGLIYYLYRFYDPNLQRWPNRDPWGEPGFSVIRSEGGAGVVPNSDLGSGVYTFVRNSPLDALDPFGLSIWETCKKTCKDLFEFGKKKAKEKVKEKISDELKEWLAGELGQKGVEEAQAACEQIEKCSFSDANYQDVWTATCQVCAVYRCALSSATPAAARTCLNKKASLCFEGVKP